jgi:hypothetical protein
VQLDDGEAIQPCSRAITKVVRITSTQNRVNPIPCASYVFQSARSLCRSAASVCDQQVHSAE